MYPHTQDTQNNKQLENQMTVLHNTVIYYKSNVTVRAYRDMKSSKIINSHKVCVHSYT